MTVRRLNALGHAVAVETNSEEFAAVGQRLLRSFPEWQDPEQRPEFVLTALLSADPAVPHRFYRGGRLFRETRLFWKLVRWLEWQLDVYLWHHDAGYMLMQAGAVAIDGAGVLIPGSSRAGKSSLTMSLLLRGGGYLSDEVGVVTKDTHEILAFPKPLSSRDPHMFPEVTSWFGPEEHELGAENDGWVPVWFTHADDVRPGAISDPVRASHIIFPEPAFGGRPVLEPISESEALKRLHRSTVNFKIVGREALHALGSIAREARAYRLMRNGM